MALVIFEPGDKAVRERRAADFDRADADLLEALALARLRRIGRLREAQIAAVLPAAHEPSLNLVAGGSESRLNRARSGRGACH
jgi:hypothetical protein